MLLLHGRMDSLTTQNRTGSMLLLIVLSLLSLTFVEPSSLHQPINSLGWSRRRITQVALSSSLSRVESNPFYSTITEVISTSTKRRKRKQTKSTQEPLSIPQRLISGGCSRGIAQAVLYPVDALRTLAQTRDGRTLADVGAKALVRGCFTTSSFAVLIGSLQFCIFGATRNACGPLVSSALGAAGSCLVSVPQEVIKQRLVTGVYSSFRSAVTTIYKTEGIAGFYSAWRPTVARNVPFVVAAFTTMDFLKQKRLQQKQQNGTVGGDTALTVGENLVIGISSALIAGTLTHPADVIKTRMMTQAASTALPYKNTVDCIQTIWNTEGWKAFYSGFPQRSIYMGPLWAIQFALNGKFQDAFQNRNMAVEN